MIRLDIWIDTKQKSILESIKKQDGIPVSEQVRRAINLYIKEKTNEYNNRRDIEKIKRTGKEEG